MEGAVHSVYLIPEMSEEAKNFAYTAHNSTNHFYDDELPYTFHLKLVVNVCREFVARYYSDHEDRQILIAACWLHDVIEDARKSYSDVVNIYKSKNDKDFATAVADIVFAVTNEKGKTRKERANDKYYAGIKADKQAVFVKLCDRIANVGYSKLTQSSMFIKYSKENDEFLEKIGALEHGFYDMVDRLESLLNK